MDLKRFIINASTVLALGLGPTLALLWRLNDPGTRPPVARAASHTVCLAGPPTCGYSTIQAAVDAASDGDVIYLPLVLR